MDPQWDDSLPIYRQLRDRIVAMILEGVLKEGEPLPSVRSVAAEFRLNPLTVLTTDPDSTKLQLAKTVRASAAAADARFLRFEIAFMTLSRGVRDLPYADRSCLGVIYNYITSLVSRPVPWTRYSPPASP